MRLVAHHIVLLGNFKREITPFLHLYCGNGRILDLYRNLNGRWLVGDGVIMGMLGLLYGYRWRGRSRCMVIIKMIFDVWIKVRGGDYLLTHKLIHFYLIYQIRRLIVCNIHIKWVLICEGWLVLILNNGSSKATFVWLMNQGVDFWRNFFTICVFFHTVTLTGYT